jgi:hypothetical protein
MSTKVYTCARYPQLAIAGICKFVDGVFDTDDRMVQERLERTDSFRSGLVRALDLEDAVEQESWERPTKSALVKMTKAEITKVANRMGLIYDPAATRAGLLAVVLEQYNN